MSNYNGGGLFTNVNGATPVAPAIQRVTPNSGDTIVINNVDQNLILIVAPAADLASLTFQWPVTPFNGREVKILSTANIASINHTGNALNVPFSFMKATGSIVFTWDVAGPIYMCNGINATTAYSLIQYNVNVGASGNIIFNPTVDGTTGTAALFSEIDYVTCFPVIASPLTACSKWVTSNGLKTVTINSQTIVFTGVVVLTLTVLGSYAPQNTTTGTAMCILVQGKLA